MLAHCFHALGHICKCFQKCKNLHRIGPSGFFKMSQKAKMDLACLLRSIAAPFAWLVPAGLGIKSIASFVS